jgi:hypothetical protein
MAIVATCDHIPVLFHAHNRSVAHVLFSLSLHSFSAIINSLNLFQSYMFDSVLSLIFLFVSLLLLIADMLLNSIDKRQTEQRN